jgi:hypothetical protein
MRITATLCIAILAALPFAASAQPVDAGSTNNTRKPIIEGAKENAAEAGRAMRKSANEVADGVKRGTRATERRVAVAVCADGAYSYTHKNTCSDHGGIRERLKK